MRDQEGVLAPPFRSVTVQTQEVRPTVHRGKDFCPYCLAQVNSVETFGDRPFGLFTY